MQFAHMVTDKLDAAVRCADKQQRDAQESEVRADVLAHFEEIYPR